MTNPQNVRKVHEDAAKWIADVKKVRDLHENKIDEFYQAFIAKKGQPTSEDVKKLDAELDRWETLVKQIHHDLEAMEKAITGYGWRGDASARLNENRLLETIKKGVGR